MSNAKNSGDASPAKDLLTKKRTGSGPHPGKALDHLAIAILGANGAEVDDALTAIANLHRDFVDWNEIRVARIQELARSLGDIPGAEASATGIRETYNAFFDKKGALNFEFLAGGKPSESRRTLNQLLPRLSKNAASLLLFEFCPGAQIPLSDGALRQAKRDGILGKSGDRGQLARILTESLGLGDATLLIQYWEIEATGSPYGEALKKDNPTAKKPRRAKAKATE